MQYSITTWTAAIMCLIIILEHEITGKRINHLRVDFCGVGTLADVPSIVSRAF